MFGYLCSLYNYYFPCIIDDDYIILNTINYEYYDYLVLNEDIDINIDIDIDKIYPCIRL